MLNAMLNRAAAIWDKEEFDENEEVYDIRSAWGQAVEETITTDALALSFVTEILGHSELAEQVKWGAELLSDDESFADVIRNSLYGREPFVAMVKEGIPDYAEKMADRKARAEAYHSAQA
ncbi:MAG TPA: hypothetical protein VFA15_09045 [Nitrososphaera sp.]|nr:hypothetical protein [Nitrososphaera sp.]